MFKKLLLIPVLLMAVGCQKPGQADFVTVCHDHQEISVETCNALSRAVAQDLADRKAKGSLKPKEEQVLIDLIARLNCIRDQSIAIDHYVSTNVVSAEILDEIIKNKIAR